MVNKPEGYRIKCKNEDFQVTEVSLMPPLTSKKPPQFTYFWLQKSGLTTFDVLDYIKSFFNLKFEDVANQGLKDEDAITEQLISVKKILSKKDITAFNKKYGAGNQYALIKHVIGYGDKPIKERMLHGNSFRIVVRNLKSNVAKNLLDYLSTHRHHQFVNYYDNQRFGMPGGPYNTHLIGEAIVERDWIEAYRHIKATNNILPSFFPKLGNVINCKEVFKKINPKKVSFFVSSYNSFLWNNQTSLLIRDNTKAKKHHFENVGNLYLPTTQSFQCPYICEVNGYEFEDEKFTDKRKVKNRNVVVATTIYADNLEKDELHRNKKKLTISFFLPTGSYATMIIKQIFLKIGKL
ncbi:TPA: tRNA pseudouridine(13) synthase TruD [bacterium]|nr:tRNA pseudouridine(13) synthase TruD [bacterium]